MHPLSVSSADVHTKPDHGHLDLFLDGQCHKMDFDGYIFEGLNFLICAEGFQDLSKVFKFTIIKFLFASWKLLTNFANASETRLRISFPVVRQPLQSATPPH